MGLLLCERGKVEDEGNIRRKRRSSTSATMFEKVIIKLHHHETTKAIFFFVLVNGDPSEGNIKVHGGLFRNSLRLTRVV